MIALIRWLWPLLFLGLAGCTGARPSPQLDAAGVDRAWSDRRQQLAGIQGFDAQGRIAVKGGGLAGALSWQQRGEHFRLRLAGPLGVGALLMEGTPQQASLRGKDLDLTTDQPEEVLAARTGWRLPLDALRWWVLGLPDPAQSTASALLLDDLGRALAFEQAGWQLRYSDYGEATALALPRRVEARQTTADGEWKATVILESLTLLP